MKHLFRLFGSLSIAVPLLVSIAGVLAWGTLYETRFGTAAVQRFIYQSWWFQLILAFLGLNLALAALQRLPWRRRHLPFVLAHIGIIGILVGGIIGGRFGIEGQMIIPEGESTDTLQLPHNVLVVHQPNPGIHREFVTNFEATAWIHNPHRIFPILQLKDRSIQLVVDRYYPHASIEEEVSDEGTEDNPAVHVTLSGDGSQDAGWLFARDMDRFGARWGEAHVFFLEPTSDLQLKQLLEEQEANRSERGVVQIEFPDLTMTQKIPVPLKLNEPFPIDGTPYQVTFKDYFADFALSEEGPVNRSDEPNNPAVSLTLTGPEGTDVHLLFALHPDFQALHGIQHKIHAHIRYEHPAGTSLPPHSIGLVRVPSGGLVAVLTDDAGHRQKIDPLQIGTVYDHPGLGNRFEVTAYYPRAKINQHFTNLNNEVQREALHVVVQDGDQVAQGWVTFRGSLELRLGGRGEASTSRSHWLGDDPLRVEYRPGLRQLPMSVKLLDFRKIDYPGTQMAAGFESDVELTDPEAGLTLKRNIRMNTPLKYKGFTFFQSSYLQAPVETPFRGIPLDKNFVETTILSVRNDPGTPLVYTGFVTIVLGIVTMFVFRKGEIQ